MNHGQKDDLASASGKKKRVEKPRTKSFREAGGKDKLSPNFAREEGEEKDKPQSYGGARKEEKFSLL